MSGPVLMAPQVGQGPGAKRTCCSLAPAQASSSPGRLPLIIARAKPRGSPAHSLSLRHVQLQVLSLRPEQDPEPGHFSPPTLPP